MKKIVLVVLAMIAVDCLVAQTTQRGKITVVIADGRQSVIENATVELLKSKDSSLAKTAISDRSGLAEFDNIRRVLTW